MSLSYSRYSENKLGLNEGKSTKTRISNLMIILLGVSQVALRSWRSFGVFFGISLNTSSVSQLMPVVRL